MDNEWRETNMAAWCNVYVKSALTRNAVGVEEGHDYSITFHLHFQEMG
jgi:hypothetical protein